MAPLGPAIVMCDKGVHPSVPSGMPGGGGRNHRCPVLSWAFPVIRDKGYGGSAGRNRMVPSLTGRR